jgi:acetyltransferase-like isoleucine patch superfamily enzyme
MNRLIGPECIEIGDYCSFGNNLRLEANSTVSGEFGDYCVLAGSPAKIIKKYDFEKKEWIKEKQ